MMRSLLWEPEATAASTRVKGPVVVYDGRPSHV
jgi:hypothetical protein